MSLREIQIQHARREYLGRGRSKWVSSYASTIKAEVLGRFFAIHQCIEIPTYWTLTHVPSGSAVTRRPKKAWCRRDYQSLLKIRSEKHWAPANNSFWKRWPARTKARLLKVQASK